MTDIRLIKFLSDFLSERRLNLINQVLDNRTRYATVLLEDIYQSQNASAVLRTCEIMGIQDLHVVENRNNYFYNPGVAMGAGKWVDIHKYNKVENNSYEALRILKSQNYRIVATVPAGKGVMLEDFDIYKGKFAIVIGSEINGISQHIIDNADELVTIPMFGFTESYNLSVSTAIILYHLIGKLQKSDLLWHLSDEEKNILKLEWLKASVKKSDLLVNKYNETYHNVPPNTSF